MFLLFFDIVSCRNTVLLLLFANVSFLGGDFNCFRDSEPVALLKKSWALLSPVTFSFPSHAPDRYIDYIFVRPNGRKVTVKEASIPQTLQSADLATASDHLPVVLTVAID